MNNIVFVLLLLIVGMPRAALAASKTLASGIGGAGTQVQCKVQGRQTKAVVIGVSEYQDEYISDLRFAGRDAGVFADYLQSNTTWEVSDEQLRVLIDSTATLAAIQAALAWQQQSIAPGEVAVIYFAGHGDVETDANQESGYLLAHDTPKNNYKLLALSVGYLNQHIDTLSARGAEVILITDACHAGTLAGDQVNGRQLTSGQLIRPQGAELRILSCQPYEKSIEFANLDGGRGAFSYYLLQALDGKADADGNREVDLFELDQYLKEQVRAKTKRAQHPEVVGDRMTKRIVEVSTDGKKANRLANRQRSLKDFLNASLIASPPKSQVNYKRFATALKRGRLADYKGKSAFDFYQLLRADTALTDVQGLFKRQLTVALLDSVQQAIRAYLDTDPTELIRREKIDARYAVFPTYLAVASELLGEDDPRYQETIAKKLYFESLVMRLQAEREGGSDSLYVQAVEKITAALDIAPSAAYLHNELGLLQSTLGQRDAAYYSFGNAMEYAPTWALAINNFASVLKEYGPVAQFASCEQYYLKAISLKPNFATAHMNYGNLLVVNDQQEKAEYHLRIARDLGPEFIDAHYNLAICICDAPGKQAEAIKLFRHVLDQDPDYVIAYNGLGLTFDALELPDSASINYRKAVVSGFTNYAPSFDRLRALLPPQEAVATFKKALAKNPALSSAYLHWALAEKESSAWLEYLLNAPLTPSGRQSIFTNLGYELYKLQDLRSSEKAFLNALRLDEKKLSNHTDLIGFYSLSGQETKAVKVLKKAFALATPEELTKLRNDLATNSTYQPLQQLPAYNKLIAKYDTEN